MAISASTKRAIFDGERGYLPSNATDDILIGTMKWPFLLHLKCVFLLITRFMPMAYRARKVALYYTLRVSTLRPTCSATRTHPHI